LAQFGKAKLSIKGLLDDPNALKSKGLTKDKYFERDEVSDMLATACEHFLSRTITPQAGEPYRHFLAWYPFILCGFRTGLRSAS